LILVTNIIKREYKSTKTEKKATKIIKREYKSRIEQWNTNSKHHNRWK